MVSALAEPRPKRSARTKPWRNAYRMTVKFTGPTGTHTTNPHTNPASNDCNRSSNGPTPTQPSADSSSSSTSSSSGSISRRQRLLTHGRTKPYSMYATNTTANITSLNSTIPSAATTTAANAATCFCSVQSIYLNVGYRTLLTISTDNNTIKAGNN